MSEPLATPVLRMERTFDAPVDRVFRAWSDPGELAQWAWGPTGSRRRKRATFVHEGVPEGIARDTHEKGWADTFDTLAQHLRTHG